MEGRRVASLLPEDRPAVMQWEGQIKFGTSTLVAILADYQKCFDLHVSGHQPVMVNVVNRLKKHL